MLGSEVLQFFTLLCISICVSQLVFLGCKPASQRVCCGQAGTVYYHHRKIRDTTVGPPIKCLLHCTGHIMSRRVATQRKDGALLRFHNKVEYEKDFRNVLLPVSVQVLSKVGPSDMFCVFLSAT